MSADGGTISRERMDPGLILAAGVLLSWPVGEYERLVGPVHLSHLFSFLAFILVVFRQVRARRISQPFDLAVAAGLAVVAALLLGSFRGPGAVYGVIAAFAAFFGAASLRLPTSDICILLRVLVFSCTLAALATLCALFLPVMPTAWSQGGGARVLGQTSLPAAGLVLVTGLAAILVCPRKRARITGFLFAAICLPALLAASTVLVLRLVREGGAWEPPSPWFMPGRLPVTLAVLWVVSLCAAKLLVAARLGGGWPSFLLGVGVVALACAAFALRAPVQPGLAFLLGCVVAAGYPGTGERSGSVPRRAPLLLAAAPVLLLGLAHLLRPGLFPGDARNYASRARVLIAEGQPAEADRLLFFVLARKPREAAACYWRGRAALAAGRPDEAVDFWQRSVSLSGGVAKPAPSSAFPDLSGLDHVVPPPSSAEWEEARALLRDHTGGLPEASRGWSLERLLLALGEREAGLGLLRMRTENAADQPGPPALYARALSLLLGFPELASELETWRAGELVGALSLGHPYSAVVSAPLGYPEAWAPLVAAVRTTRSGAVVQVWTERGAFGGERLGGCDPAGAPAAWMSPETDEDGGWRLSAPPVGRVLLEGEGLVSFDGYDAGWGCDGNDGWQVICVVP